MDEDPERRVDEVIDRIRRSGALPGTQLLRVAAAERRSAARATAWSLAESSGRTQLASRGRQTVRQLVDRRYVDRFNVGIYYGTSADPSTARDRIELALALEDLVLGTVVEDLLEPDDYGTLATDGALVLVDIPAPSAFPSVSYAPVTAIRTMQVVIVAMLVIGSLIVGALIGIIPALFGGCLAAAVVGSRIYRGRGASGESMDDSETD